MSLPRQLSELVQGLTPEMRRHFQRELRHVHLAKGETLFSYGSAGTDVFFVIEGRLGVCLHSHSGREVLLRIADPGDLLGELAAIDGGLRAATVIAKTRARVGCLPAADFRDIIATCPKTNAWLMKKTAAQMRSLTDRLYELATLNVSDRVRVEILRLASEAGVQHNKASIVALPTHRELASKLGTTREAVTREINDLQKRKLISKKRGRELTVLDCRSLALLLDPAAIPAGD